MAIYVYETATGRLVSTMPGSVVEQQAVNLANPSAGLIQAADLAARGLTAVDSLPDLDSTHAWDAVNKTVAVVAARKSVGATLVFWQRFTPTEREAIENLQATGTQAVKNAVAAFKNYIALGTVDCNDAYVQAKVNQLETAGVLAAGRAAQILV